MPAVDLVVPGDPLTPTGGYIYDRRVFDGLAGIGWTTQVHSLAADFPRPSASSVAAAAETFAAIPSARAVVVDGLALAGLSSVLRNEARRLRLAALVHHPVADEHGLSNETRAIVRENERETFAIVERVIVTSRWTARRVEREGVPAGRIRVVEPGTDRPRAAPAERRAANNRVPRLLCVATVTERKGHAVLLDALARLRDRPWRLDCVGSMERDSSTADAIARRIHRLGLERRVALHGEVPPEALDSLYASADAFVLPSYLEGYGMALAEAIARGLPVLSTTAGAIPETVGDAGLLVPPGNAEALAAALERLLLDDRLRARCASAARARAATLPSWADASAGFAAAIEDLADGGAARLGQANGASRSVE